METKAVDFVQYTVEDLDASLPFYQDTLGLHLEKHLEELGWAEFAVPPTTLALHEAEADERPGADDGGAAVALAVDDVAALRRNSVMRARRSCRSRSIPVPV